MERKVSPVREMGATNLPPSLPLQTEPPPPRNKSQSGFIFESVSLRPSFPSATPFAPLFLTSTPGLPLPPSPSKGGIWVIISLDLPFLPPPSPSSFFPSNPAAASFFPFKVGGGGSFDFPLPLQDAPISDPSKSLSLLGPLPLPTLHHRQLVRQRTF